MFSNFFLYPFDLRRTLWAQKHVKAKRYYTIRDDGRKQAWGGRIFLNPPYAMPYVKQFAEKITQAWADGEIDAGIMLVNNATDTEWP
jgi:hypothetical protein